MDISKDEQRVLHVLAQGGWITPTKAKNGRIISVVGYTREGWRMPQIELLTFRKLRAKRALKSHNSKPYRITRRGLVLVRGELNNR